MTVRTLSMQSLVRHGHLNRHLLLQVPSREERRRVFGLRQPSTVSRNSIDSRRPPASPWTRTIKTLIAAASPLDRESEDAWHGLLKAQRPDLCKICASASSPIAVAMSAAGGQSTQLGHCNGYDLATRRGTQRALDLIELQRFRHVWVHVPSSSISHQRQQKILNKWIWMLPEMQHRGCEVHVGYTAVVSKFERAVEQWQKHLSYKVETHGWAWELRKSSRWCGNCVFCGFVRTHFAVPCPAVSVTEDMLMPLRPVLLCILEALCKTIANKLMNTTSTGELHRELCAGAEDQDEVDRGTRLDEEIPRQAGAEVSRVEVAAAVALELTARQRHDSNNSVRNLHWHVGHCTNRRLEEMLRRRGKTSKTLLTACQKFKTDQTRKRGGIVRCQPGESVGDRRHAVATSSHGCNVP